MQLVASGIQPLQNGSVLHDVTLLGGAGASRAWAKAAIARGLTALEAHAKEHAETYCVGDTVTLADVFLVPQLYNARRFEVARDAYTTLLAIDARLSELPAFSAAHPDRQPDARSAKGASR